MVDFQLHNCFKNTTAVLWDFLTHRWLILGTCDGGIFTYEKTTGHFLRTAQQEPLVLETQAPGITLECSNLCSGMGSECPAFTVDYGGQRCFKMDRNTQGQIL